MITFYEEKDLVSFDEYLLSQERTKRIADNYKKGDKVSLYDRTSQVYHADFENWKESQKSNELVTDSNEVVTE